MCNRKKNSESMLTKTVKKIVSSSPKTETSGFFVFLQIDLKKQHKQLYFRLSWYEIRLLVLMLFNFCLSIFDYICFFIFQHCILFWLVFNGSSLLLCKGLVAYSYIFSAFYLEQMQISVSYLSDWNKFAW